MNTIHYSVSILKTRDWPITETVKMNFFCPNLTLLTAWFNGWDVLTKIGRTFTDAQEQFWLDTLPAATSDSYRVPEVVEPRFAGCKSVILTTEPWLLPTVISRVKS